MSHHNIEDFKPLSVSPNFGVFDRPKKNGKRRLPLPQPETRVGVRRLPLLPCGTSRASAHRVGGAPEHAEDMC